MQQNKTLFFAIIGLAILALAGMFAGAYFFLGDRLDLAVTQSPVAIRVAVATGIKPWAEQAAQQFNRQNPGTTVEVIDAGGLIPNSLFSSDPQADPPAAWLAEAGFVLDLAANSGLSFEDPRSVASTELAWGGFTNRLAALEAESDGLDWAAVHDSAVEPNSSLKVVIASPQNSAEGLAALISAAAAQAGSRTLTDDQARQAEGWLSETLPDSARGSLTLGPRPAEAFATRGASIGDVGMLSQASWRSAGLENRPNFTLSPARYNVTLDYPFAVWAGSRATPEGRQAAAAFRDFLLSQSAQDQLADFYFSPAGAASADSVQVEPAAALTLLRWAEREFR